MAKEKPKVEPARPRDASVPDDPDKRHCVKCGVQMCAVTVMLPGGDAQSFCPNCSAYLVGTGRLEEFQTKCPPQPEPCDVCGQPYHQCVVHDFLFDEKNTYQPWRLCIPCAKRMLAHDLPPKDVLALRKRLGATRRNWEASYMVHGDYYDQKGRAQQPMRAR